MNAMFIVIGSASELLGATITTVCLSKGLPCRDIPIWASTVS